MRNGREVMEGFKNSRHRKTTIIPTKIKIKITILIPFIVLQSVCLSLVANKMIFQIVDLVAMYTEPRQSGCRSLAPLYSVYQNFQRQMAFVSLAEYPALDTKITLAEDQAWFPTTEINAYLV